MRQRQTVENMVKGGRVLPGNHQLAFTPPTHRTIGKSGPRRLCRSSAPQPVPGCSINEWRNSGPAEWPRLWWYALALSPAGGGINDPRT